MTDLPVAGQPHALTYQLRINGTLTDLPTGGSVDQIRLLLDGSPALTVPGPATRISVGTYQFDSALMPAAADYVAEVTYRTSAGGPDKLDTNQTVRVYDFDGNVDDSATADISLIRLLISDLSDPPTFPDSQLQQLLDLEGAVKLAAASALDVIASNEAMVSKRIRTLDLQTDGPAVAKALREHAAALRAQYLSALEDGTDEIQATTDLGWAQFPGLTGPEITQGW